jgi:hypothetical protein
VTGANIFVNWRALESVGVDRNTPITLALANMPLSQVLDQLLTQSAARAARGGKPAKLGYTVDQGVIVISIDEDLKQPKR